MPRRNAGQPRVEDRREDDKQGKPYHSEDKQAFVASTARRPGDLPGLLALYRDLHPEEPELNAEMAAATWEAMLTASGLTGTVAELAGLPTILGATCTVSVVPNLTRGARPYALVENVVTLASHRQQGLGRAVLEGAQEVAWAAGCYKVMLATGSRREETLCFYERAGFERGTKTAFQVRRP